MRRGASSRHAPLPGTGTLCVAVSQTTATAAPSSALYEWPQSRDALLATPPPPRPPQHSSSTAANSRQRKEIKCTSFMRELGSYFHPPPHPFSSWLLPCSSPLSLPPSPCPFSLLSLSTQCANNGSALLTQKVALWRQCSPRHSPSPLSLCCCCCSLFSLLPLFSPPPAWQHLDWFIAHSLQRRLVQSALAKWSEGGKAAKRECKEGGGEGNLPHE